MTQIQQNIKKVIIKKENLPEIEGSSLEYKLRFRILSDDRNRSSSWSPVYNISVSPEPEEYIQHSVSYSEITDTITAVWTMPTTLAENPTETEILRSNIKQFDIYIKWDSEEWKYVSTTNNTMYIVNKKTGSNAVKIAVQKPTFPKNRFAGATLFESSSIAL